MMLMWIRQSVAAEKYLFLLACVACGIPVWIPHFPPMVDLPQHAAQVAFDRRELNDILAVYGRMVAAGEWRDYAIDLGREKAVFAVFRRTSEVPLYQIEKNPKLARKQGAYSVVTAAGVILKRGHELRRVLDVFAKGPRLVSS